MKYLCESKDVLESWKRCINKKLDPNIKNYPKTKENIDILLKKNKDIIYVFNNSINNIYNHFFYILYSYF